MRLLATGKTRRMILHDIWLEMHDNKVSSKNHHIQVTKAKQEADQKREEAVLHSLENLREPSLLRKTELEKRAQVAIEQQQLYKNTKRKVNEGFCHEIIKSIIGFVCVVVNKR